MKQNGELEKLTFGQPETLKREKRTPARITPERKSEERSPPKPLDPLPEYTLQRWRAIAGTKSYVEERKSSTRTRIALALGGIILAAGAGAFVFSKYFQKATASEVAEVSTMRAEPAPFPAQEIDAKNNPPATAKDRADRPKAEPKKRKPTPSSPRRR